MGEGFGDSDMLEEVQFFVVTWQDLKMKHNGAIMQILEVR